MKYKVLLVEDDEDFGHVLKQYLELSNFEVSWYQNPEEVALLFSHWEFHIGILDVMMPKIDGFTLAQTILKEKPQFPLLFLTAKNQKIDRITGLKIGAEDYLAKPCEPEELVLRLNNILKRSRWSNPQEPIALGSYTLHPETYILEHAQHSTRLTKKEIRLLLFLLKHNHSLVSKEDILNQLWEETDYFSGRSLDVFISRIRKYFQHEPKTSIDSVRGVGYQVEIFTE
ncbi:response regulator transcription factor [Riemerella columbina]|uniref:response regulator transcription factor n=1 Tax=Riemerella columbina TaxID=103810 RepID=UPI000369D3B1|nr:response regulator transcription factor [Riemerella columbina]